MGHGILRVFSPQISGGAVHYWRNNDNVLMPWGMPTPIATGAGQFDSVSMIEDKVDIDPFSYRAGTLEVVVRVADKLLWLQRRRGQDPASKWHGPYPLYLDRQSDNMCFRQEAIGVSGNPVLIQSNFGNKGNFELVVPRVDGGFNHYFRYNDHPNLPWMQAPSVGIGQGHIDAISLIQSNFGTPGNLEVVARMGDQLLFFFGH